MNKGGLATEAAGPSSGRCRVALRRVGNGLMGAILGSLLGGVAGGISLFVLCALLFGSYTNVFGLVGGWIGGSVSGAVAGCLAGATGREDLARWCGRLAGVLVALLVCVFFWGRLDYPWSSSQWLVVGVVGVGGLLAGPLGSSIGMAWLDRSILPIDGRSHPRRRR